MSTAKEKLGKDLEFVELLASQLDDYLLSQEIFWKTTRIDLPDLSLGGYLMRQQRLLSLPDLLSAPERTRLDRAVSRFNQALAEKGPLFARKAQRELEARLRQWAAYLNELEEENSESAAFYGASVETRAMIAALIDKLDSLSYSIEAEVPGKLKKLDDKLRRQWTPGEFVWPNEWQPAYPQAIYWWLYGQPGAN